MRFPLLPKNRVGRLHEGAGLKIRSFAGVPLNQPLEPHRLARSAKIIVATPGDISGLPRSVQAELLHHSSSNWSAVTFALPDGWQVCILNANHGIERQHATLMEEIAHVILGHRPTRIAPGPDGLTRRDYNGDNEKAAYGAGAAALVPFAELLASMLRGQTPREIANRFGVSPELVEYRIKITLLWKLYKSRVAQGT